MKNLELFIPVIVDGDEEKDALKKYGVRGYPTVKFTDATGKVHAQMQGRTPGAIIGTSKGALKSMGPLRLTKKYQRILKAKSKIQKSMPRKKYKNALKGIADIEKVGHEGDDLNWAREEKKKIVEIAETQLADAKELVESDPTKAKDLLKQIAKEFKGLEVAQEAKKLADSIAS